MNNSDLEAKMAETIVQSIDTENVNEVTLRTGAALPLKAPIAVNITGILDSASRWCDTKQFDIANSHVIVDRDKMSITLIVDETSPYRTVIEGRLMFSPQYEKFGINKGEYITHFEMAELIKFNRVYFENKTVAMKLVSDLQNFKAKVNREVEESNNNRGDRRMLLDQAVQHNLPDTFSLTLPVFKGMPEQTIAVEVYVNPSDLTCTLVSVEATDYIESMVDTQINAEIEAIRRFCPGITIIEV